jgi:hypothetical protein
MEGETVYCSDTRVTCDVGGTEEVRIKVEEAKDIKEEVCVKFETIYLKDETLDAAIFPPIKTEQEVRLWGVCEVVAAYTFRPFIAHKGNSDVTLHCFILSCYVVGAI